MNESSDVFRWADEELTRLGAYEILRSGVVDRARTGLGGSHTVVTYPPLDSLEPIDSAEVLKSVRPVAGADLYLHIPFCEFICHFCHYDTEFQQLGASPSDRNLRYMDALARDIDGWSRRLDGSTIRSLYIGGGTPTAATTEQLLMLLETATRLPKTPGFRACIETSPLTATAPDGRAKLEALVAAGINRVSIGVQSFAEPLLRQSRGHGAREALEAVRLVTGIVGESNIDLIQDLPGQTDAMVLEDVARIAEVRPAEVSWYILRLQNGSAWHKQYSKDGLDLAPARDSLRRRLALREAMRRIGYHPAPGGRFMRDEKFRDHYKSVRMGLDSTLVGIGLSSYSHGWGWAFRNVHSMGRGGMAEYVRRVHDCGDSIDTALAIDATEAAASALVAGIRSGARLAEAGPQSAAYLADARLTLERLSALGLVRCQDEATWRLTELGELFEEEVCSFFYSDLVRDRVMQRSGWWRDGAPALTAAPSA
jgi:oxygen-independent coproporphyrinogen III oxidase